MNDDDRSKTALQIGIFITIPFVLAVPPLIGVFIGRWLDEWLDTQPYLMYVFLLLGLIAGFKETYRLIKKYGNGN